MADRTVYYAKITRDPQTGAFDQSFAEGMLEALDPHHEVTRYRRTWRVSRPRLEEAVIVGKLGFVRTAPAAETRYDENLEDFVTAQSVANEGSFSMFAIDTRQEILTFEERPPAIQRQSFLGAFRGLLHTAQFRGSVTLLPDPTGYREFVRSVDRLERVRAVVFSPNPRFRDEAASFEAIIDQANAQRAEVVAVSKPGGGLNPDAQWIEGALEQVASDGKGSLKAVGVKDGHRRTWALGARLQVDVITDNDAQSPEGVWEWMKQRLAQRFHG